MTLGDLAVLIGYGLAAFLAGYGLGVVLHAIKRFFEHV